MSLPVSTLRVFRVALHLWVLGFLLSTMPMLDLLYTSPLSPRWVPPGPMAVLTHALGRAIPAHAAPYLVAIGLLLAAMALFRRTGAVAAFALWWIHINLMGQAWLAGSGGQQLMAVVLFWNIGLSVGEGTSWRTFVRTLSFWMIRMQLLLAYAVTAAHKLTGNDWPSGDALGVVLTDEAFGPAALANWPMLCSMVTWAALLLQATLPFALWWRPTRVPWIVAASVFHLATALWLDIPEMGLAFCAVLTSWLSEGESTALSAALDRKRRNAH